MQKIWQIVCLIFCMGGFAFSLQGQEKTLPVKKNATIIFFRTSDDLEKALEPLTAAEVTARIALAKARPIEFQFDHNLSFSSITALRREEIGNLLKTKVWESPLLTVYTPEKPRVPNHLTIALNRRTVKGIADVSSAENAALFATIRKVAEVYKTLCITGFVIAQFDQPQEGHQERYVVEVIPHLPGFRGVKNTVDKADCNRYVLFRRANLSPVRYALPPTPVAWQSSFWKEAFKKHHLPLHEEDTQITFPYKRYESHQGEAEEFLHQHLLELLQDKGGRTYHPPSFSTLMPQSVSGEIAEVNIPRCVFCDQKVIQKQLVYESEGILVFYNVRKGAYPATSFLLLPRRHVEKVYGLNAHEIEHMAHLRKALTEVLNEEHPQCEVIVYTQDDPSVGQTVPHSHEQVVAVNPDTVALTWTLMSLYPSGVVSDEEMKSVCEKYHHKLDEKMRAKGMREAI